MTGQDQADLGALYLKTIVTIEVDGDLLPIRRHQMAPDQMIHVITAWNPGDERPTNFENEKASTRLKLQLEEMGVKPVRALGSDPDSDHAEESWAVTGLSDQEAMEIGNQFGQVAVFRLAAGTQTILWCDGSRALTRNLAD